MMSNESIWRHYSNFAEMAYNAQEYEVAGSIIRLAVKAALQFGEQDIRFIKSIEHLGDIYLAQGRKEEACLEFQRAFSLLRRFHEKVSIDGVRLQMKTGKLLSDFGRVTEANILLCEARSSCNRLGNVPRATSSAIEGAIHQIDGLRKTVTSPLSVSIEPEQSMRILRAPTVSPQAPNIRKTS